MKRLIAFSFAALSLIWKLPAFRFHTILQRRISEAASYNDTAEMFHWKLAIRAESYQGIDHNDLVAKRACIKAAKDSLSSFNLWLEFFTGVIK